MNKFLIYTIATLLLLLPMFSNAQADGPSLNGMLKFDKKTTYWDKDHKIPRSIGYYRASGSSSIGEKFGKWKFFYKDGGLEEISNYYDGKLNGAVQQFYSNGNIKFKGYFYLGVPNNSFEVYHTNGKLAEEGNFNSIPDSIEENTFKYWNVIEFLPAIKVGEWKSYYESGRLKTVTQFKDSDTLEYLTSYFDTSGTKLVSNGNGTIKENYYSKKPKLVTTYKNGLKDGVHKSWNANGTVKEEGAYKDGLQTSNWKYYFFVSGKIYQEIGFIEGEKHGFFEEHMPNEIVSIKGNYKHGKKDSIWAYYFEDGQLDMQGNFVTDLQDGHWKYWYPNGKIYYEGDYKTGKKDGYWEFFYNNEQLWRDGEYRNDKKDGVWNFFYESGVPLMTGSFNEDLEHGAWVSYYENGQEKDRGSYDQGKMTASWEGWYPNGKKKYEGNYLNDMRTGNWKFYSDKGKLTDDGNFKILKTKDEESVGYNFTLVKEQSYKHGPWKSYSTIDYKLTSTGTYNRGRQTGKWKYYYPGGKVITYENTYNSKGKLSGVSKSYSRRGKVISEIGYKDGKKHGDVKTYAKKGKLIQHLVYKNGIKTKDVLNKQTYKYSKK